LSTVTLVSAGLTAGAFAGALCEDLLAPCLACEPLVVVLAVGESFAVLPLEPPNDASATTAIAATTSRPPTIRTANLRGERRAV